MDSVYFNKNEYEIIYNEALKSGGFMKFSFWIHTELDKPKKEYQYIGRNIFFTLGAIDEHEIDENFSKY